MLALPEHCLPASGLRRLTLDSGDILMLNSTKRISPDFGQILYHTQGQLQVSRGTGQVLLSGFHFFDERVNQELGLLGTLN
jgi:hypothetical protein